jgi:predicted nucleotidyltransferase
MPHSTNNSPKVWNFREFLLSLQSEQLLLPMDRETMTRMIAEYFKTQPVLKAWLFGSFARGEEREDSDVDLLILFDHSSPIGLFSYARMHRELEERLGRKVDLVEEGTLRPAAAAEATKDMKMIYERVA